jgi:cbb3-type cytochrome oxidase subunit 3
MEGSLVHNGLIIFLIFLFILAILGTFFALKQEERKMKKYEEEGDTIEDQLSRSLEYESTSLKSNVRSQIWIYSITITLALLAFFIYLF